MLKSSPPYLFDELYSCDGNSLECPLWNVRDFFLKKCPSSKCPWEMVLWTFLSEDESLRIFREVHFWKDILACISNLIWLISDCSIYYFSNAWQIWISSTWNFIVLLTYFVTSLRENFLQVFVRLMILRLCACYLLCSYLLIWQKRKYKKNSFLSFWFIWVYTNSIRIVHSIIINYDSEPCID
jgi:hypothetical protein